MASLSVRAWSDNLERVDSCRNATNVTHKALDGICNGSRSFHVLVINANWSNGATCRVKSQSVTQGAVVNYVAVVDVRRCRLLDVRQNAKH